MNFSGRVLCTNAFVVGEISDWLPGDVALWESKQAFEQNAHRGIPVKQDDGSWLYNTQIMKLCIEMGIREYNLVDALALRDILLCVDDLDTYNHRYGYKFKPVEALLPNDVDITNLGVF